MSRQFVPQRQLSAQVQYYGLSGNITAMVADWLKWGLIKMDREEERSWNDLCDIVQPVHSTNNINQIIITFKLAI